MTAEFDPCEMCPHPSACRSNDLCECSKLNASLGLRQGGPSTKDEVRPETLDKLSAELGCSAPADYMVEVAIDRLKQGEVHRDERGFEPCPWHRRQYPHVLVKSMGEGKTKTHQLIARCDMCFSQRAVLVPPGVMKAAQGRHDLIILTMHKDLKEAWNWSQRE